MEDTKVLRRNIKVLHLEVLRRNMKVLRCNIKVLPIISRRGSIDYDYI